MPFILSSIPRRPRILVINPNATESFSQAMAASLPPSADYELDFFTAPTSVSPLSIEGSFDSVVSATACLSHLRNQLGRWNGFVVACFSAHPLVPALRELTSSPVIGILEAPLLLASTLGTNVSILTTSPRWVPLLTHDIHSLHLHHLNSAGVVSSGLSVLDLEKLPREEVVRRLGRIAREELQDKRGSDVIVLGCAGMVGLDLEIKAVCKDGMTVLDPVRCAVEVCGASVRMAVGTSKVGIYASAER